MTAIKNTIRHFGIDEGMGPRELGRYIRPMIGLTEREEIAVEKVRARLIKLGKTNKQVIQQTNNYQARLWRLRAERIARTETSFAYNNGSLEQMTQYQERGLINDPIIKRYHTAEDERVCPWCNALNRQVIGLKETFPGYTKRLPNVFVPPVHPNCRCTIIYEVLTVNKVVS